MAAAHSRAYRRHLKLNSEVLALQQLGAAESMRMRAKQKEIFIPQMVHSLRK